MKKFLVSALLTVFCGIALAAQGPFKSSEYLNKADDILKRNSSGEITSTTSTDVLGSSSNRWDKIWADDIDTTIATIGGLSSGAVTIDVTDAEALLIRKAGDTGDVFIVDTVNGFVGIGKTPTVELDVTGSGVFSDSVLGGNTRIDDDGIDFRLASFDDMIIQNYALDKGIIFKHNLGIGQEIMLDMDSATETHDFQDWDITTTGIVGIGKAPVVGSRLNLPLENDAVTPTLSFGDGDTGIYESADDTLSIATAGVVRALITDAYIESSASNPNWRLQRETASATNPVYAFGADDDTGIGSAAADQLSLIAGGVEQMRLTQNDATDDVVSITGNVGIGTTAPDGRLHVMTASAGTVTADSSADDFVIENSTHGGLTILTPNTTTGGIYFGDPDDNNAGRINYSHSADKMEFLVNSVVNGGATALTIQPDMDVIINSGNVGIGTTAPTAQLHTKGNLSTALTGTLATTASSTTVTGSSTLFTTQLAVGDAIKIGSETFTIANILSATSLTLDSASAVTASGVTAYKDPNLFAIDDGDGTNQFVVDKSGNTTIAGDLTVSGTSTLSNIEISTDSISAPLGSDMSFKTGPAEGSLSSNLVVTDGGNVGIGTTAPGAALTILNATEPQFVVRETDNGNDAFRIQANSARGYLGILSAGVETINLNGSGVSYFNSGNVGIGTTTPAFKLDVVGNIGIDRSPDTDDTGSGITTVATVDTNAFGVGACLVMAADGNYDTADADASTTAPCEAMALETGTGSKKIMLQGYVRNDGWNWTMSTGISNLLYLSTTTGEITQTAPSGAGDQVQIIGRAISADVIYFDPSFVIVEISA